MAGVDVLRGQSNQRKHVSGMSGDGNSAYGFPVEREGSPGSYGISLVVKSCVAAGAKPHVCGVL
jgi:hypothetical protein